MTSAEIYWLLKLDALRNVALTTGVLGPFIIFFATMCRSTSSELDATDGKRLAWALPYILVAMLSPMIPSTKEMCVIKAVPWLLESEAVETVAADVKDIYSLGVDAVKDKLGAEEQE